MSLLHLPAQHQWTSLSVAIFKKATSRRESSSLRPDGNYSTFAWWVRRVRTYACMYVRVLERTLAAVGRNFSSFISPAWIDEKKPLSLFFSPFWIAVSLLFIWVFIISRRQPESFLKWSHGGLIATRNSCDTRALAFLPCFFKRVLKKKKKKKRENAPAFSGFLHSLTLACWREVLHLLTCTEH